jgi:hypothetical protein
MVCSYKKVSNTSGNLGNILPASEFFGTSVSSLGDLDGDGVGELLVGATGDNDGSTGSGAAFIVYLDTDDTVKLDGGSGKYRKISNPALGGALSSGDGFGSSVADLGDLDGAGGTARAIAVGAWKADSPAPPCQMGPCPPGTTDSGAVYIVFLKQDGTVDHFQTISNTSGNLGRILLSNSNFGVGMAYLGEFSIAGGKAKTLAVGSANKIYILFLNPDGTVNSRKEITDSQAGAQSNTNFGYSVGRLGDIDGDGVPDIIVGARKDNDGGTERGAVWILLLNADGSFKATLKKISDTSGNLSNGNSGGALRDSDWFGTSVSGTGDLGEDGVPDIIVGSMDDEDGSDAGAAYVIYLNVDGTVKSKQKIPSVASGFTGSLTAGALFGSGVALTGEKRISIGAKQDGADDSGAVYNFYIAEECSTDLSRFSLEAIPSTLVIDSQTQLADQATFKATVWNKGTAELTGPGNTIKLSIFDPSGNCDPTMAALIGTCTVTKHSAPHPQAKQTPYLTPQTLTTATTTS